MTNPTLPRWPIYLAVGLLCASFLTVWGYTTHQREKLQETITECQWLTEYDGWDILRCRPQRPENPPVAPPSASWDPQVDGSPYAPVEVPPAPPILKDPHNRYFGPLLREL